MDDVGRQHDSSEQVRANMVHHAQHPMCCSQVVANVYSTYINAKAHQDDKLRKMQHEFYSFQQQSQNESRQLRDQLNLAQQQLYQERQASEMANQQIIELDESHLDLQKSYKNVLTRNDELEKSVRDSREYAEEVSRQAGELADRFRAEAGGSDTADAQIGRSISATILESAKNAQLVDALSGHCSEEHAFSQLKCVTKHNIEFQLRNNELAHQIKVIKQEVENKNNDIANLKMALELTSDDIKPKRTRRGKSKSLPNE